jgi:hypothetical protein
MAQNNKTRELETVANSKQVATKLAPQVQAGKPAGATAALAADQLPLAWSEGAAAAPAKSKPLLAAGKRKAAGGCRLIGRNFGRSCRSRWRGIVPGRNGRLIWRRRRPRPGCWRRWRWFISRLNDAGQNCVADHSCACAYGCSVRRDFAL